MAMTQSDFGKSWSLYVSGMCSTSGSVFWMTLYSKEPGLCVAGLNLVDGCNYKKPINIILNAPRYAGLRP